MSTSQTRIGFRVQIIVEPDDTGFHAYCPALKGLHTSGATVDEAVQNAKDATIAYLQSLIKHGDPIPIGIAASIAVALSKKAEKRTEDLLVACVT